MRGAYRHCDLEDLLCKDPTAAVFPLDTNIFEKDLNSIERFYGASCSSGLHSCISHVLHSLRERPIFLRWSLGVQLPVRRPASGLISCLTSRCVSSDLFLECFRNTFQALFQVYRLLHLLFTH